MSLRCSTLEVETGRSVPLSLQKVSAKVNLTSGQYAILAVKNLVRNLKFDCCLLTPARIISCIYGIPPNIHVMNALCGGGPKMNDH